jgi:hypothetical protein
MKALYRTVSAVLAVASGVVIAGLIVALTGEDDLNMGWFAVFALGALVAAGAAMVLWAKAIGRR